MRESFTYGTVGEAPGNRCFYPEPDRKGRRPLVIDMSCSLPAGDRNVSHV
jgi:hypothetical protein